MSWPWRGGRSATVRSPALRTTDLAGTAPDTSMWELETSMSTVASALMNQDQDRRRWVRTGAEVAGLAYGVNPPVQQGSVWVTMLG